MLQYPLTVPLLFLEVCECLIKVRHLLDVCSTVLVTFDFLGVPLVAGLKVLDLGCFSDQLRLRKLYVSEGFVEIAPQ